jgi:outer membrane protein assembly factor BamA
MHHRDVFARVLAGLLLCAGCASLPKGEYGVNRIRWTGVDQMSSEALESCLATKKRDHVSLRLGLGSANCGAPPFDSHTPEVSFWAWPWTDWPTYDPAIFEIDQKRVLRWYQARGFYDTKLTRVQFEVGGEDVPSPDQCKADDCELTIALAVDEGEPVIVRAVEIEPDQPLDRDLMKRLERAVEVRRGARFDEAVYDADKERLVNVLKEHAYAQAKADGHIAIDRSSHVAEVRYLIETGPVSVFGAMTVEGEHPNVPAEAITDVAHLEAGGTYKQSDVVDAERAVYALGVFSAVKIEPRVRENTNVVDLVIHVAPAAAETWRFGVGLMSGVTQTGALTGEESVPEWDVHLRAAYSNENFLGGMRKLRVEERPRLIFLDAFPGVASEANQKRGIHGPRLGNTISLHFEQPRFPEHRTVFFSENVHDYGPDPYLGYFRHDITLSAGLRRKFFQQTFLVQVAVEQDLYLITDDDATTQDGEPVSSYFLPFLEQTLQLDLRNDAHRATKGVYLAVTVQEALSLGYGSWRYVRVLPEARAYQKLLWKIVLAERVAFGALFMQWADPSIDDTGNPKLDEDSRLLGPQKYRLRGGGATSNRGFAAGTLGAGVDGGTRRWEATVELRIPLSGDLSLATFFDTGDVAAPSVDDRGDVDQASIRFSHLNASAGLGLRFYTPFAPIRFDAGWRIPGLQVLGDDGLTCEQNGKKTNSGGKCEGRFWPSAMFLTIGEAF